MCGLRVQHGAEVFVVVVSVGGEGARVCWGMCRTSRRWWWVGEKEEVSP